MKHYIFVTKTYHGIISAYGPEDATIKIRKQTLQEVKSLFEMDTYDQKTIQYQKIGQKGRKIVNLGEQPSLNQVLEIKNDIRGKLAPPAGYMIITKGEVKTGDLAWTPSKNLFLPVDIKSINQNIDLFYGIARKI